MSRLRQILILGVVLAAAAHAASYTVGYQKMISIPVPGATAAYAVDPQIADASADRGMVAVTGKMPGSTHLIVVTPGGVQTLEIVVPVPAPIYPKGWVPMQPEGNSNDMGYFETRYSSVPEEFNNTIDFTHQGQDMSTHFHLVTTNLLPSAISMFGNDGVSSFEVTSLSYAIQTQQRSVTLVDQLVDESPLTVSNAVVRGLHWQEGDWIFHAGYTSLETFEGLFLPLQAEGVFGAGYRYRLSPHSRLIPSFYYLTMPSGTHAGNSGAIVSLQYLYKPSDNLHFAAEIGESRGLGASSSLTYRRHGESLHARFRYTPEQFAALSISNFRGTYSDLGWTRQWFKQLGTDVTFTGDRFNLPTFKEISVNGSVQLRYSPLQHWMFFGGATYSLFHTEQAGQVPLEGLYYPEGVSFNSRYFGLTAQYQWSRITEQSTGGKQYLASAHTGFGHFSFSGYAERETDAPTLGYLVSQSNGLAQLLAQYGVTATTPQQITEFLTQNAALINLQYVNNLTIYLTPLREQFSASASWQGRGNAPQIDYQFLRNNDQSVTSDTATDIQRITINQHIGASNEVSLTAAEYKSRSNGQPSGLTPLVSLSYRHQFNTAPGFLMLEHHGTIRGRVFDDRDGQGVMTPSAPGVAGVELVLDNVRRTLSGADGSYHFSGIPEGKHSVQAILRGEKPYYFTTPEQAEAELDSEVDFGVARSFSSLGGEVMDDVPHGVSGIVVVIQGDKHRVTAVTRGDGKFLLPRLEDGDYSVSVDAESLPAGYVIDEPALVHIATAAGKAPRASLRIRAIRNVSGRVLLYDRTLGKYVGVPGLTVVLAELSLKMKTDGTGRFLFRELHSGTYTVSAEYQGQTINRLVTVPDLPGQLTDIDLIMGQR